MAVREHSTADYLGTPEAVAAYIEEFLSDDPELLIFALREIAESVGFAKLAEQAGVTRQHLYTMLSENGNPTLRSLTKIVTAIGCRISIVPVAQEQQPLYA